MKQKQKCGHAECDNINIRKQKPKKTKINEMK